MKPKTSALLISAVTKFGLGFLLMGAMLFGGAGTFHYPNAWLMMASLFVPMLLSGAVLLIKAPEVLARRLASKEPEPGQRKVIAVGSAVFVACFVLAGLDHRFAWSGMPMPLSIAAVAVMLLGYGLFVAVIRQNAYAARVVDVMEGQKVITTGLYALVRHPMYLASLLVFLPMPLILGSYFALIPMLGYLWVIAERIRGEEAYLSENLPGYPDYIQTTRHRLIPFIW